MLSMDEIERAMDDQGWCEVKKKHRGGSKPVLNRPYEVKSLAHHSRKNSGILEANGTSTGKFNYSRKDHCGTIDSPCNILKQESLPIIVSQNSEYGSQSSVDSPSITITNEPMVLDSTNSSDDNIGFEDLKSEPAYIPLNDETTLVKPITVELGEEGEKPIVGDSSQSKITAFSSKDAQNLKPNDVSAPKIKWGVLDERDLMQSHIDLKMFSNVTGNSPESSIENFVTLEASTSNFKEFYDEKHQFTTEEISVDSCRNLSQTEEYDASAKIQIDSKVEAGCNESELIRESGCAEDQQMQSCSGLEESKERFRERLWCFLFENLNRAIDELYLLCELECDVEQTEEAIIVLQEAISDFQDLTNRVKDFEHAKKVPFKSSNDSSVLLKSDHRRPHALSWEVRRMSTSSQKAEILSSSLEAFKKIQQEFVRKELGDQCRDPSKLSECSNKSESSTSKNLDRKKETELRNASERNTSKSPSKSSGNRRTSNDNPPPESDRESKQRKSLNAWKEKRNWEEVVSSSRASFPPTINKRNARNLHDKLMSPEKKKKTSVDLKKEAEQKHARAMRIRTELETERVQKLQRTYEKLNRVNEWQAVRKMKLIKGLSLRHQRSESRHEAFIAQVVKRAGDESSKVSEVRFITSLNEENKRLIIRQKLQDSEFRRAEILHNMKIKQKEDTAREEAAIERRKLIEAGKLQRMAEMQRKKEEAQIRREEERRASSAAREARSLEQMRRREERAKAQQEEAELMAQKLAERLNESEQRRKFYLEQIRERAFRDQSSPLLRRNKDPECSDSKEITPCNDNPSLKRKIKKIRQRLMSLKHDSSEPTLNSETTGIGYRTAVGTARGKIGKWIQELQRLRQARKEGAVNIGLITSDIVKFLEGKEAELRGARQAGLLDFIASALPASHASSLVTIHFLKLLKVTLSTPANVSYFLSQNLLPPIVPLLSSALESFVKMAASTKTPIDNCEANAKVFEGFLVIVDVVMGYVTSDEKENQMQDGLLELITAYQVVHRFRDLFALYDRPQIEGSPFPNSILSSIHLLVVLTSRQLSSFDFEAFVLQSMAGLDSVRPAEPEQPVSSLLSAVSETGLVCLTSLLTSVLLQANNKISSELGGYVLPSNFEEVATGVLKVLNNLARLDVHFIQTMLARPDLKTEFFHLMSFLLSHCTSKWKSAHDQVGLLLLESLTLIGYFSLLHPENQAVLRWGKSPTILHKVCDLPFVFFSVGTLMPALGSALASACFESGQNKGLILEELSIDMISSLLNSCKNNQPRSSASIQGKDSLGSQCTSDLKRSTASKLTRFSPGKCKSIVSKTNKVVATNKVSPRALPTEFIDIVEAFFNDLYTS